jgi:hypothetical protein
VRGRTGRERVKLARVVELAEGFGHGGVDRRYPYLRAAPASLRFAALARGPRSTPRRIRR